MFFCWYLMVRFGNEEHLTSWVYMSLHGTYGMLWLLKEMVFPDTSWMRPSTLPVFSNTC